MSYEFRMELSNDDEEEVELFVDFEDGTIRIDFRSALTNCAVHPTIEDAEQILAGLYRAIELAKESKQ